MSTIKSDNSNLILNADGASKEVKIQRNGTQVLATTSTGIDVTGVTTTDGLTSSGNITFDNGNSSVSIKSDGADGSYIQFGSNEYLRFLYDNGASESIRLIDGGGITFNGDTTAANALDDYEEGTWTPSLGAGSATVSGKYIKIGNQVTVECELHTFSDTFSTNVVAIWGLPFTNNTQAGAATVLFNNLNTDTGYSNIVGYIYPSNSLFRLYEVGDNINQNTQTHVDLTSTTNIKITATYTLN
jgi:hypothetical protein